MTADLDYGPNPNPKQTTFNSKFILYLLFMQQRDQTRFLEAGNLLTKFVPKLFVSFLPVKWSYAPVRAD